MKYSEAIKMVLDEFPELVSIYKADEDYYEGLPYLFYESIFEKYIAEVVNDESKSKIKQVFLFIENVLENSDSEFVNLIGVAVIESLYFEKDYAHIKSNTKKYWGPLTTLSFMECEN